jgi:hypothetical protein
MPGVSMNAVRFMDYDWPLVPHCEMPQRAYKHLGNPVFSEKNLQSKNPEPNFPHFIVVPCPKCCLIHTGILTSKSHVLVNKMPAGVGTGGKGSPVVGCGVAGASHAMTVFMALV